ncbi:B12-binding domain-containing radical SAM protein [Candidatus Woesearchaeota archaeon]|nr:B12-binding domain-containing radical SAM protein [Candidatus Woesearchaeota archaeon]
MKTKDQLKTVLCSIPVMDGYNPLAGDFPAAPKIAIISILKWMEKHGYSGEFYDIDLVRPTDGELLDYFGRVQPDVVGLSAVVSTSYGGVKKVSGIIRKSCPSCVIVVGGNMAVSSNLILRKTDVDYCVLGDGEISFVSLLDYVAVNGREKIDGALKAISGLAFINRENEMEFAGYGNPIPDGENQFPDYGIIEKGLQKKSHLMMPYFFREASKCTWFARDSRTFEPGKKPFIAAGWLTKGCVGRCTFCQRFCKGYHTFDTNKFDQFLSMLKENYNTQFFSISGENFGLPREYAHKVAEIFKKHGFLWIMGGARCTNFRPEDYKFFSDHGCLGIKFGVESGSQKILDIMEKRFKVEDVYNALKLSTEAGMFVPTAFCMGMPGETDDTITQTGKFLGQVHLLQGVPPIYFDAFYALPLPGAPLYEYGQLKGVIGTSLDEEEDYLTYVSGVGANKDVYINLSGASVRTYLFWDYLLCYEATREYYNHNSHKPVQRNGAIKAKAGDASAPYSIAGILRKSLKNTGGLARGLKRPISSMNAMLCRSRAVAKLPRWAIYPLMRNSLYAEHLARMAFLNVNYLFNRDEKLGRYLKFHRKKCRDVLENSDSLRKVNERLKASMPMQNSLTERNQRLLYEGR